MADADERQQEDSVHFVRLTKSLRHFVACRFDDHAPHDGNDHAKKHYGRGVIGNGFVKSSGKAREARHHKAIGNADDQNGEGAQGEDDESREDEDVENSSGFVARMLPLAEPVLEHIVQAKQRVIEAQVAFCSHQRSHAASNDVREAQHA